MMVDVRDSLSTYGTLPMVFPYCPAQCFRDRMCYERRLVDVTTVTHAHAAGDAGTAECDIIIVAADVATNRTCLRFCEVSLIGANVEDAAVPGPPSPARQSEAACAARAAKPHFALKEAQNVGICRVHFRLTWRLARPMRKTQRPCALLIIASLTSSLLSCGSAPAPAPPPPPHVALPSPEPKGQLFHATAYSIEGKTASGSLARQGIVAADPAVLPLGTRVRIEGAGQYDGEYVVTDTGGKIDGREIDIYLPNDEEAKRFGNKTVRVEVLQKGDGRRSSAN